MKMVKSLLLGSAAGLMAVAGAQAADLPVKAAPVEYVKVCSLYGAGFYYIPGTDICVKFGGYVRGQYYANTGNSGTNGYFYNGAGANQNTRSFNNTNDFIMRSRTIITMDARSQTDWGTVRAYMNIGWTQDSPAGGTAGTAFNGPGPSVYANRAFIQWAGFTFGKAQSFYDLFPLASFNYHGVPFSDTGDSGVNLAAYTLTLGNGLSTTFAIEEPRRFSIFNVNTLGLDPATAFFLATPNPIASQFQVGGQLNNSMAKVRWPDAVGNFRIDQAWGSFQVMGALHDVAASYYFAPCQDLVPNNSLSNSQACGYPGDKIGWAAGVGATFNLPFIAKGDRFSFQVNVTEGAFRYVNNVQTGGGASPAAFTGNYSLAWGMATDAILRDNIPGVQIGSLELTRAWGAIGAYEHLWTPALKTSWYGGLVAMNYNQTATDYICGRFTSALNQGIYAVRQQTPPFSTVTAGTIQNPTNCNPDWSQWYVGTRTQWNIRPDFYMGVDLLYQRLNTSFAGFADFLRFSSQPAPSFSLYKIENADALSLTFRVHRDILP